MIFKILLNSQWLGLESKIKREVINQRFEGGFKRRIQRPEGHWIKVGRED